MRTREQIYTDARDAWVKTPDAEHCNLLMQRLTLETLLDIRELLMNPLVTTVVSPGEGFGGFKQEF